MIFASLSTALCLPLLALGSPLVKRDYPDPICSGDCSNQVHDPSVVRREDGTYFRFTTLDLISIATAPSIDGPWTLQGSVLDQPSIIDLEGNDVLWVRDGGHPTLQGICSADIFRRRQTASSTMVLTTSTILSPHPAAKTQT